MDAAIRGSVGCTYLSHLLEGGNLARHSGHHALVIASNRLPVRLTLSDDGIRGGAELGRARGRAAGRARRCRAGSAGPAPSSRPRSRRRSEQRLARDNLVPVLLSAARGGGLLRPGLQRHALAALPLLLGPAPDHSRGVGAVRRGERAFRGRHPRAHRAGEPGVGPRLPPDARAGMLRRRDPSLSIGFFLHTPVPVVARCTACFRPASSSCAACSGPTTSASRSATTRAISARRACGSSASTPTPTGSSSTAARVGIGVDPIGIDVAGLPGGRSPTRRPRGLLGRARRRQYEGRRLVLGVERLDYTKGIPQKLHAFERFLEQDPARARTTTMIQVLVPSRLESPEYRAQRDEIELLIARINGRFGQPGLTPVEYIHRDISKPGLVALYRRADVMMVTAAARRDEPRRAGVRALPVRARPAGPLARSAPPLGARRLGAGSSGRAARQPVERRRGRRAPRDRARAACARAAAPARDDGEAGGGARQPALGRGVPHAARAAIRGATAAAAARRSSTTRSKERLCGAGSPAPGRARSCSTTTGRCASSSRIPDLARPTPEIRALLRSLAALPATDVHIVSGRRRRNLEQWFGRLPVHLCAEHGYLARAPGGEWRTLVELDLELDAPDRATAAAGRGRRSRSARRAEVVQRRLALPRGRARVRLLARARAPERPRASISRARPPRCSLGHQVVEVRAQGVDKGLYVRSLFPDGKEPTHFVLGLGDDRTDHDLLDALPPGSVAGHVGGLLPSTRATDGQRGAHPHRRARRGARVPARSRRGHARARASAASNSMLPETGTAARRWKAAA